MNTMPINSINPRKLMNSKWTAVKPVRKEKHFIVTDIEHDDEGAVTDCMIESEVYTRVDISDV